MALRVDLSCKNGVNSVSSFLFSVSKASGTANGGLTCILYYRIKAKLLIQLGNMKTQSAKNIIFSLAPMESVTDSVFRQVIIKCGRPDLFYTEFTNCDALVSKGRESALQNLKYTEIEKPIVAQLWGIHPENFDEAVKICIDLGFDGIDINMGCPVKKVLKVGAGGATIQNQKLAKEIIEISKNAIEKYSKKKIPLSVKTRIGYDAVDMEWIKFVLSQRLDVVTFHVRTVKELSKSKANWEIFKEIIPLRNEISPKTLIFGNGDVYTKEQLKEYPSKYGVDGVMVGRGIFANPWIFNKDIDIQKITKEERISLLKYHIELFEKTWGDSKNIQILKKYFKIYLKGSEELNDLKDWLMETKSYEEMYKLLK